MPVEDDDDPMSRTPKNLALLYSSGIELLSLRITSLCNLDGLDSSSCYSKRVANSAFDSHWYDLLAAAYSMFSFPLTHTNFTSTLYRKPM